MNNNKLRFDELPEILPAYENGIFQAMLTLPEAKTALISAVSVFLGRPAKTVTLRSNITPSRHKQEKLSNYDINCVVDSKDELEKNEDENIKLTVELVEKNKTIEELQAKLAALGSGEG